jgi:hypothetical protein
MSGDALIGLDPELTRGLAGLVTTAGENAGHVGSQAANVIAAAQLDGGDAVTLCTEIDEELDLLARLLRAKATEMEMAAAGIPFDAGASWLNEALWASLTDDVGEGIDFGEDAGDADGGIPLGPSVAARLLALYLQGKGDDEWLEVEDLQDLVDNAQMPPELRAAAQYFLANDDIWSAVREAGQPATAERFEEFVATNAALAVLAAAYLRFDTARQNDPDEADGYVSDEDLQTIIDDETGRFSEAEKEAARWLLEHGSGWAREREDLLTMALFTRQVFAEHPELAVSYLDLAVEDPTRFVMDATWFDQAGGKAWLASALASTDDPGRQAQILLTFASVYRATMPEPIGLLDVVHDLLDWVSFVDPTQLADAINAGIYVAEGDELNAGISAAGILLPLGGGKAIRLTSDAVLRLAARQGDDLAAELLEQAIKNGDLTPEMIEQTLKDVADQFGDDTADALRRRFEELQARADAPSVPRVELEGRTDYQVVDPTDPGRTITDIDVVENGVMWEVKTATNALDPDSWAAKHVTAKLERYLEARQVLDGWDDAPIGMRFETPGADPAFREAVERAVADFRQRFPDVDVRIDWAE